MKKLLLLSVVLLLFAGCSKDETTSSGQADQTEAFVPHFYGAAMLNTPLEMVSAPVWYMGGWKFLSEAVRPKVHGQTKGR